MSAEITDRSLGQGVAGCHNPALKLGASDNHLRRTTVRTRPILGGEILPAGCAQLMPDIIAGSRRGHATKDIQSFLRR